MSLKEFLKDLYSSALMLFGIGFFGLGIYIMLQSGFPFVEEGMNISNEFGIIFFLTGIVMFWYGFSLKM